MSKKTIQEGSLEAPTRHPLDWKNPEFYKEEILFKELERVYDICHGCRRCVNLCNAFPVLFDLIDESETFEIDGVAKEDYYQVVEHCYLCDLCYLTKCPYVPPHEWNVDFPHLMLQGKAVKYKKEGASFRDKALTSTEAVGNLAGIPVVSGIVNAANNNKPVRRLLDKTVGIHPDAVIPKFHSKTLKKRFDKGQHRPVSETKAVGLLNGKVALFSTCYCNRNEPDVAEDLISVLEHNGIPVSLVEKERCCGMPKLELGDLETVETYKNINIPILAALVDEGWDLIAPIPSCVLMFKQELPLMFPEDEQVQKVKQAFYDPFEYMMQLHKHDFLNTDFKQQLGKVAYHAPCHQRVQKIGLKTKEVLELVPGTSIELIERCSGHDGTYAVKSEMHEISNKICRPIVNKITKAEVDHYVSDCPMAGAQIQNGMKDDSVAESPFTLLCYAYGLSR